MWSEVSYHTGLATDPHGYGMVLSSNLAECLAEALSPPQTSREPQTSRTLAGTLDAWLKGQACQAQRGLAQSSRQAQAWPAKAAALSLSIFNWGVESNLTWPSWHPYPSPWGPTVLSSVPPRPFVPAAMKAPAVSFKYTSTPSRTVSFIFFVLEILYNLKFFMKIAMRFTWSSVWEMRVENTHWWFGIPLGSSL